MGSVLGSAGVDRGKERRAFLSGEADLWEEEFDLVWSVQGIPYEATVFRRWTTGSTGL